MDPLTVDTLAAVFQEPQGPLLRQVLRMLGPDRTTAVLADMRQCETHEGQVTLRGRLEKVEGRQMCVVSRMQGALPSVLPLVLVALGGRDRVVGQACPVLCSLQHSRATRIRTALRASCTAHRVWACCTGPR